MSDDLLIEGFDADEPLEKRGASSGGGAVEAQISAMRELLIESEAAEKAVASGIDSGVIPDPGKLLKSSRPSGSTSSALPAGKGGYHCLLVKAIGKNKASFLSDLMNLTGLDFFSVVEMSEHVPGVLMFSVDRDAAEAAKSKLEARGALVELIHQELVPDGAALVCGKEQKDDDPTISVEGFYDSNDVILEAVGDHSGSVSRVIRDLTGRSFHGAMYLMESVPVTVLSGVGAPEASRAKARLELAGAKVSVRPTKA